MVLYQQVSAYEVLYDKRWHAVLGLLWQPYTIGRLLSGPDGSGLEE